MGKKSSEFWVLSERRINKAGRFEVRSSRFSEPRNSSLACRAFPANLARDLQARGQAPLDKFGEPVPCQPREIASGT